MLVNRFIFGLCSVGMLVFLPQQSAAANSSNMTASINPHHVDSNFSGVNHIPTDAVRSHKKRILNGSDTASFFYRVGVNNFDKGRFEKAERAFEAVLRANGLDKQALYYLARINEKQGDEAKALEYAKEFHDLK